MRPAWSYLVNLRDLSRGDLRVRLEPTAEERAAIARDLDLQSLPALVAELSVRPWLDGAEITGRFEAVVEQLCAVSLEPFEQPLSSDIAVQVVSAGSPHAETEDAGEGEHDADAPDPPDVLPGETVDLAAYVIEHLALEIDPFARKPGVEFEYEPPGEPESPFAVLQKLKDKKP